MRAIVYGGAGFLGSSLNYALVDKGITPFIFDNFSTGHRIFLNQNLNVIEGDILNLKDLEESFDKINLLFLYCLSEKNGAQGVEKFDTSN